MNAYLMGFDIGTGSSKALLTDAEGNIAARYAKLKLPTPAGRKKVWICGGKNLKKQCGNS